MGDFQPQPTPTSWGKRGAGDPAQWPMAGDLIHHAYVMKPPQECEEGCSERFWAGEHVEVLGGGALGEDGCSAHALPYASLPLAVPAL